MFNPFYAMDINLVERVQRSFTRRIPGFCLLSYPERLRRFGLDSLELRRLRADLCMCYQIVHGLVDVCFDDFFRYAPVVGTRGHAWKLYYPLAMLDVRRASFAVRVVPVWNALPVGVVSACSLAVFKGRLLDVDLSVFLTITLQ